MGSQNRVAEHAEYVIRFKRCMFLREAAKKPQLYACGLHVKPKKGLRGFAILLNITIKRLGPGKNAYRLAQMAKHAMRLFPEKAASHALSNEWDWLIHHAFIVVIFKFEQVVRGVLEEKCPMFLLLASKPDHFLLEKW